jgi:hypothetical protein
VSVWKGVDSGGGGGRGQEPEDLVTCVPGKLTTAKLLLAQASEPVWTPPLLTKCVQLSERFSNEENLVALFTERFSTQNASKAPCPRSHFSMGHNQNCEVQLCIICSMFSWFSAESPTGYDPIYQREMKAHRG